MRSNQQAPFAITNLGCLSDLIADAALSSTSSGYTAFTRQVNNITIDPLDDNYFASGGSTGDPTVSIWDKRWLARSHNAGPDATGSMPVLELRPAVDNTQTTTVWSIRFSGAKRGRFGVLSNMGELKLYDLTSHSMQVKNRPTPTNAHGGVPWVSSQYIERSHNIQYPYHDRLHAQDENSRVVAFDWMNSGISEGQPLLALRPSRQVILLHAPTLSHVTITPRDDLVTNGRNTTFVEPLTSCATTAEQIMTMEAKLVDLKVNDERQTSSEPISFNEQNLQPIRKPTLAAQRTEKWIARGDDGPLRGFPQSNNLIDALTIVNVHRRRCQEGYRLNCKRNRLIVKDDPALIKLWAIIGRLEKLATDGRMTTHTVDLSYIGVHNIWHGTMGDCRNRQLSAKPMTVATFEAAVKDLVVSHNLPRLDNLPVKTIHKRTLSLEVCGWCFSRDGMEAKCTDLLEQRQYYRAVATSFFQGHTDLSLNMLRNLTRRKTIPDTALGALLASERLNEEQRNMCIWMEEDADDPYLQSLLRFLAHKRWKDVVENAALNLSDRLSVALRYLPDDDLGIFIDQSTETCSLDGDLPGILLTGLTSSCLNLFQAYLERTNDLQTTVLATAFTNPLYVDDIRFSMWKETYLWYMQTWRAFIERTKFNVEHSRRAMKRNGERMIKPAPRQITLRCAHCNGSLAKQQDESKEKAQLSFGTNASTGQPVHQARKNAEAAGTVCPRCGRHLPRCSICMQWLGTPEPIKGKLGKDSVREINGGKEQGVAKAETDMLGRFITFCASCGHGFHAQHAKHWFAKHGMCPVPDCQCLCGLGT